MKMRLALPLMGVSLWLVVCTAPADEPQAPADKSSEIAAGRQVMLAAPDVTFRSGPSPDAVVTESPPGGELVLVVGAVDGDWLRIGRNWVLRRDAVPIEAAVEFFTVKIERQPTPFAYASRAQARLSQSQFDEALADAEEAVRLDPNFALAYAVRGHIRQICANSDAALADYDKALEIEPKLAVARRGRNTARFALLTLFAAHAGSRADGGAVKLDAEKLPDGDRRLTAARLFDRATHREWDAVGHRRAIADLDEAARLAPELRGPDFLWTRSFLYRMLHEYEKATADIREAISLEPDNADHYKSLGAICEAQEDLDGAIEHYSRAYQIYESAATERKRPATPVEAILGPSRKAESAVHDLMGAYFSRAEKRWANGDAAGANSDCNRAVELSPKWPPVRIRRGMVLAKMGKFDEALKDCDTAIELDPSSPLGLCSRGAVYRTKGDFVNAMNALNQAAALFPRATEPLAIRADVWFEAGEFGRALGDLSQAIALEPNSPFLYARRAQVFRELKRDADAAADEKQAEELFGKLRSPR